MTIKSVKSGWTGISALAGNKGFSDYQKKYMVDCKLMIPKNNSIEEFDLIYPDGLNIVMDKCWMFICVRETTQLLSTVDFF